MLVAYLKPYHPFVKLVFFVLLSFATFSLCYLIGAGVTHWALGIDVLSDPTIIRDMDRPGMLSANKILIFSQHLGMFLLPSFLLLPWITEEGTGFYLMNRAFSWVLIPGTLLAMFFFFPVINWMVEFNQQLSLPESLKGLEKVMEEMEQKAQKTTKAILETNTPSGVAVNLTLVAVLPAIGEELVFRGVMQKLIARWTQNIHWGIWIAGILFSLMHMQFYGFLPRMILGVMFGYLLIWSGSIWIPILAHFLNNAVAVIAHYLLQTGVISKDLEEHGAQNDLWSLLFSLFLLLLVLYGFYRNSRWKEIKDRYLRREGEDSG